MKTAGNRLRLGAVALLSMIAVALIAPVATSAHQTAPGNGGKCYEQVTQYKYQRATYKTRVPVPEADHERSRNDKHDPWGPWSALDLVVAGLVPVVVHNVAVLESGDHDGENDNNSTYDRDYQYVPNGVTEQVATATRLRVGRLRRRPVRAGCRSTSRPSTAPRSPATTSRPRRSRCVTPPGARATRTTKIEVSVSAFFSAGHIDHERRHLQGFHLRQARPDVQRRGARRHVAAAVQRLPASQARAAGLPARGRRDLRELRDGQRCRDRNEDDDELQGRLQHRDLDMGQGAGRRPGRRADQPPAQRG